MSRRIDKISFLHNKKLIVGEGYSDKVFLASLCVKSQIEGFEYAETSNGFGGFQRYLSVLPSVAHAETITDIVLVFDSTHEPVQQFQRLQRQIRSAKGKGPTGEVTYNAPDAPNVVIQGNSPRLHALSIPWAGQPGGVETLCLEVATAETENGEAIAGWVNTFADAACNGWTLEKKDKLRLQAFVSAAWRAKPELHFYHLFDMKGDQVIPLGSNVFENVRAFLRSVSEL